MSYIKINNYYFTKINDLIRRMQTLQGNYYYLSKINNGVSYTKYKYSKHGDPRNGIYSIGYFKESDPMPGYPGFFDEKYWEAYESLPITITAEDVRGRIYFMPNADYKIEQSKIGGDGGRIYLFFRIAKEYVIEQLTTSIRGSFDTISVVINSFSAEDPISKVHYDILKINPSSGHGDPRHILRYK
mgnify:CR=1 FL=1